MTGSEVGGLITIGVLARASGLTPSALRFYDDCGLLVPERVDGVTGYRYYDRAQSERAVFIRRLRGIGVPLEVVSGILSGDVQEAGRLLDAHVLDLEERAREAAVVARAVKRAIGEGAAGRVVLSARVLVEAIGQVRPAVALDREIPVLTGVLVEVGVNSVTLTATDRYRLSTRTVVPLRPGREEWSVVVGAGDLARVGSWLGEVAEVVMASGDGALVLAAGGIERRYDAIDGTFPDYRAMIAGLAPVRTRVVVAREVLLPAVEDDASIILSIDAAGVSAHRSGSSAVERLPATVTGSNIEIAFSPKTLRPALVAAVGPDIMLDIAAPDQPVVVRSATDGDLTTLAMPIAETISAKEHSA